MDGLFDRLAVEAFSLEQTPFTHGIAEYLMAKEPELVEILAPATRRLYWKGLVGVAIEVLDVATSADVPAAVVHRITQTQLRPRAVAGLAGVLQVQVPQLGAAVLWIDGKIDRLPAPGSHAFWKFNRNVAVEMVDLRLQALEVAGQEILTRDKVGLRLNLSATWRYTDVLEAFTRLQKPAEHLYRELQFGRRSARARWTNCWRTSR